MEKLLKQILEEIRKTNKRLESIENLLSQDEDSEEEDEEENNTHRTLDGGFYKNEQRY